MSLRSGEAMPSDGLSSVLCNTSTVLKHVAQFQLSKCMPLCSCKAPESHSLRKVLPNTQSVLERSSSAARPPFGPSVALCRFVRLCHCRTILPPLPPHFLFSV